MAESGASGQQTTRRILYYSTCVLSMQHDVKILARSCVRQRTTNDAASEFWKHRPGCWMYFFAHDIVCVWPHVCQHFVAWVAEHCVLWPVLVAAVFRHRGHPLNPVTGTYHLAAQIFDGDGASRLNGKPGDAIGKCLWRCGDA